MIKYEIHKGHHNRNTTPNPNTTINDINIVDATQKKGKQFNPALISQERKPCIYYSLFTFPARAEIELENSARKKTETRRSVGS